MELKKIKLFDIKVETIQGLKMNVPLGKTGMQAEYFSEKVNDSETDMSIVIKLVSNTTSGESLNLQVTTIYRCHLLKDTIKPINDHQCWQYAELYVIAESHARMVWFQYTEQKGLKLGLLPHTPLANMFQQIKADANSMWN